MQAFSETPAIGGARSLAVAGCDYARQSMPAGSAPKRAITAPKGRPTRSRHGRQQRRVFGSTAQWLAAIAVVLLVLIIVIIVFDDKAATNAETHPVSTSPSTATTATTGRLLPLS
jgi:hypothetical protein